MSELASRVTNAIKPSGFVDFYEMLDRPTDAPADALRSQINVLYSEAQANRDHRNIAKRREYEMLLELLPFARTVMLEEGRRERYDSYRAEVQSGAPTMDFETFMNEVTGRSDADASEKASLLGVQDSASAKVKAATARPAAKPATATRPATRTTTRTTDSVAPAAKASLMGTVMSVIVFVTLLVVTMVGLKLNIGVASGVAAVAAVITWFATHKTGRKVST